MQNKSDIDEDFSIPPQRHSIFWTLLKMLYFCFAVFSALCFMLTSFKLAFQMISLVLVMFIGPLSWALYRDFYAVNPELFRQRSQRYEEFLAAHRYRFFSPPALYHYFAHTLLAPTAANVGYGSLWVTAMALAFVIQDC